jgi:hypothetical protein
MIPEVEIRLELGDGFILPSRREMKRGVASLSGGGGGASKLSD